MQGVKATFERGIHTKATFERVGHPTMSFVPAGIFNNDWILRNGFWDNEGQWINNETWNFSS